MRSSRCAWPTSWASTRCGPSSTTSSRSTRTVRPPSCSSPPARWSPGRSGWATASSCASRSSTIPSRSPSAPPCSTSCRAAPGRRHGPLGHLDGAGRLPHRPRHHQEVLGRVRALPAQDVDAGDLRLPGRVLVHAGADDRPQGLPAAPPALWVAVTSPGTELDAADRGLGSLGLTFGGFAEQEKKIAEYRRRIQLCEPVGEFVNDQVSTVNFLYCHEDDATGRATGRRMADRSTTSPPSSSRRARPIRPAPTRRWASCPSCAARPPAPTPTSRRARAWPSAARSASCAR